MIAKGTQIYVAGMTQVDPVPGDGAARILAEIGSQPVSGFYLRPGLERLIERVEEREQYPAPAVSSRDGVEPDRGWPAPVMTLEREARAHGWETVRAYARGRFPHGTTGAPLAERETFSVRFGSPRGAWQGYAIYAGGGSPGWSSIMVTGALLPPFGAMNRGELSAWLAEPEPAGSPFYDMVRERVRRQEADRKARESCNKGGHDMLLTLTGEVAGVWCRRCGHGWVGDRPWSKPKKGKGEAL